MIQLLSEKKTDRVALRGVRVHSRLAGMSQKTQIQQTFVNLEDRAIEAVYTFPLPDGAAVCAFEVLTGDRVLTGQVQETDQAIEKYDQAISEGHAAFLMEEDRPDVFTVRVGNIKPRQAATIRITYIAPLTVVDREIRLVYPTTVAPRYVTDTGTDPITAAMDDEALNPPHVLAVPYGLSLDVEIDLGRKLAAVESPTHEIAAQEDGKVHRVWLAGGKTPMDRDIVLTLKLSAEAEPCVQVESGPDGDQYIAVTFVPQSADDDDAPAPQPTETVFVVDCSGSMAGESIGQAKDALTLCLRSLADGDRFNICRFGSTYVMLSPEPLEYSAQTLRRALAWVDRMDADLGGTELHEPLKAVLAGKPSVGDVRQVIVLTDGQISNETAVLELARDSRAHNRIFTFGIGAASSASLVNGLARNTGGAAEFIAYGERIDDKVLRTFGRMASVAMSDAKLEWDGAKVQVAPAEMPPLFEGDGLSVWGRVKGTLPRTVTLKCSTPAGPRQWTLDVPAAADQGGAIRLMWARKAIQQIEDASAIEARARRYGPAAREQKELIELSKHYGLLCRLTTFVAIEHRSVEDRNDGKPELRRVPVMLARGWGGVPPAMAGAPLRVLACPAPAAWMHPSARGGGRMCSGDSMSIRPPAYVEGAPMVDSSDIRMLLSLQTAAGSFTPDDAIWEEADDGWRAAVEQALDAVGGRDEPMVATVLALLVLTRKHPDEHDLWRRAYDKAVRWLIKQLKMDRETFRQWFSELGQRLPTA